MFLTHVPPRESQHTTEGYIVRWEEEGLSGRSSSAWEQPDAARLSFQWVNRERQRHLANGGETKRATPSDEWMGN